MGRRKSTVAQSRAHNVAKQVSAAQGILNCYRNIANNKNVSACFRDNVFMWICW